MRSLGITNRITNRDDSIDQYLRDLKKENLLTLEEEIRLAEIIKNNGEDAKEVQYAIDRLTIGNLRFVVSVAKQYQNQGLDLKDLINEGNLGLIKAAKRFDPNRGFKFISYAVWWIRQSILGAIKENSKSIRLPLNQVANLNKLKRAESRFFSEKGYNPSVLELAEILSLSEKKIKETISNDFQINSTSSQYETDEYGSNYDFFEYHVSQDNISLDQNLLDTSLSYDIKKILSNLSPIQYKVIIMYFGLDGNQPMSLQYIADKIGCSREGARQIKINAIKKIKNNSKAINLLKEYL